MSEDRVVIQTGSKLTTIFVFVGVILIAALGVVGYFAYKSLMDENANLKNEIVSFKKLTETLVRSSTTWATKKDLEDELKGFMTQNDYNELRKDIDKLGATLTAVGRTIGTIKGKISELEKSDNQGQVNPNVEVCDNGKLVDTHGYTKQTQVKLLTDSKTAPIAKVEFNAASEKPWAYEVFRRDHYVTTVVSTKDSGQMVFHHKLEYSVPDKDKDKKYSVDLVSSDFMQAPASNKMFWLNPIVDGNFFAGGRFYKFADGPGRDSILSLGVDLGLSLSSYGPNKVDSWFRLFRFGIGYNIERQAGHFSFAPFAFNVGKPLPLLTNLYITPQIAIDTGGGFTLNIGIGPQF